MQGRAGEPGIALGRRRDRGAAHSDVPGQVIRLPGMRKGPADGEMALKFGERFAIVMRTEI